VRVGAGAHIGAGATVRQGIAIGEQAIVGAGAVVVKDVPPNTVVVGVPARPISVRVRS
jgi:UDP-perosamine 4-acetyltransferase